MAPLDPPEPSAFAVGMLRDEINELQVMATLQQRGVMMLSDGLRGVLPSRPFVRHACVPNKHGRIVPYIGSSSASPTARLLRGYGRAGTQNDRLAGHVHTRAIDMPSAMPI